MPDPDLTLLGRRIEAMHQDIHALKFAADVDRQDVRAARDVLVRTLGTSLGLFQSKVETQLGEMGSAVETQLGEMRETVKRIEQLVIDIARKLDA